MAKIDPRDFLLNTDYEMDKIIYFEEGEMDAYDSVTLPHNLGFAPLVFGVCAFESDFSDPRSIPFEYLTQDTTIGVQVFASDEAVYLNYINYAPNPPKVYYRIYAFEPSGSHAKIGATSKYAKNFILNTDYNYCKLYTSGVVDHVIATHVVEHNFGYMPQVLAWFESGDFVFPMNFSMPAGPGGNSEQYIAVTDSTVTIKNSSDEIKTHYRIYYDEG